MRRSFCICYTIFIEGTRTVYPTLGKKGCGGGGGGAYLKGALIEAFTVFFFLLSQGHFIQMKENPEA